GFHHQLQDRIENLADILGVPVSDQLRRILHVGKEHGDLLALAFECGPGGENLFGEVFRRIGIGGLASLETDTTFSTEHRDGSILVVAARAKHRRVLPFASRAYGNALGSEYTAKRPDRRLVAGRSGKEDPLAFHGTRQRGDVVLDEERVDEGDGDRAE